MRFKHSVLPLLLASFCVTAVAIPITAGAEEKKETPAAEATAVPDKKEKRHGKHHDEFRKLRLDKEQKARLKEIRQQMRDEYKAKKSAFKESKEKLKTAMRSQASDKEIEILFEDNLKLQQELSRLRFKKMMNVRAILTPEQREKFNAMREVWGKRGDGHR